MSFNSGLLWMDSNEVLYLVNDELHKFTFQFPSSVKKTITIYEFIDFVINFHNDFVITFT